MPLLTACPQRPALAPHTPVQCAAAPIARGPETQPAALAFLARAASSFHARRRRRRGPARLHVASHCRCFAAGAPPRRAPGRPPTKAACTLPRGESNRAFSASANPRAALFCVPNSRSRPDFRGRAARLKRANKAHSPTAPTPTHTRSPPTAAPRLPPHTPLHAQPGTRTAATRRGTHTSTSKRPGRRAAARAPPGPSSLFRAWLYPRGWRRGRRLSQQAAPERASSAQRVAQPQ